MPFFEGRLQHGESAVYIEVARCLEVAFLSGVVAMTESEFKSSPAHSDTMSLLKAIWHLQIDWVSFLLWPCVFSLNMILPLYLSAEVTKQHGKTGVFTATLLLLAVGVIFSLCKPSATRIVILGSAVLALTQAFPVIQLVTGGLAYAFAVSLSLAEDVSDTPQITSELGGFLVTMLVGSVLLACASALGCVLARFAPDQWFRGDTESQ